MPLLNALCMGNEMEPKTGQQLLPSRVCAVEKLPKKEEEEEEAAEEERERETDLHNIRCSHRRLSRASFVGLCVWLCKMLINK